ncbi:MAG: hypothetical protein EOP51_31020 [Sphingobacteriales bacterium]|nr:MAG: hypothetical protein EOP51_31020 [Sphingobacteriales bacterium]
MHEEFAKRVIGDHQKGLSYRTLGSKYGIGASTAYGIVMKQKKKEPPFDTGDLILSDTPENIAALKAALREERLRNDLLNTLIDIASKELGVDIRKKSGTR